MSNISHKWHAFVEEMERFVQPAWRKIDQIVDHNQFKILQYFQKHQISDYHFQGSTGYGYNDVGREKLEQVYADAFGAEAALVRPHFASGTHTIAAALFGCLRPNDRLLYITGSPYDTLYKVIGEEGDGTGSLRDFGIGYDEVPLTENESLDWEQIFNKLTPETKVVGIQKSRGYAWRPPISNQQIAEICSRLKSVRPDLIIFVDNCYGEFTETTEPCEAGADLIAGSLIKNPGGGLAETGGYIAGKKELVELAANRLTAPGIGGEVGAMLGTVRSMFQGLFLAPHFVGQALKGSVLAAAIFERLGFETRPRWDDDRSDIIQAIRFTSQDHLIKFVQSVQYASPVDAYVTPEPGEMPGYEHDVIMAAGTFIQGGSLELTADAPIREPYTAYMQGGLTYSHIKYMLLHSLQRMEESGLITDGQL